jgi:hypothetical protein
MLLASCASSPPLQTGQPVKEVQVGVVTGCVDPVDVTDVPFSETPANGDVKQKAAGVIIDAKVYRALAVKQHDLLVNCLKK